jgi:hypothetical protein
MFVPAHTLCGTAVAIHLSQENSSRRKRILQILLLAPALHFFLDLWPHWDASNLGSNYLVIGTPAWREAAIENVLGFAAVAWVLWKLKLFKNFWIQAFVLATWAPDLFTSLVLSGRITGAVFLKLQALHLATHSWWRGWYGEVPTFWPGLLGVGVNLVFCIIPAFYLYGIHLNREHFIRYPKRILTATD